VEIFIPMEKLAPSDSDRTRLEHELLEAESQILRLEKLLSGDFASRAPADLIQKERSKLASYKDTAEKLRKQLNK
jgi:valyl-tRNA synthetase